MPGKRTVAHARSTLTKSPKDGDSTIRQKELDFNVPEEILGDCNASVSRTRTVKFAVPDTFGTSVSSSCTVSLTCNQDTETIKKASQYCKRAVKHLLKEDMQEMAEFIEEMRP
jgi:hypothetical protein